jgi:hypothetical protein
MSMSAKGQKRTSYVFGCAKFAKADRPVAGVADGDIG